MLHHTRSVNKRCRIPKGQSEKGQSRKTGNIGYTRQRKTKQKHNTICVGLLQTPLNTNKHSITCY